MSLVWPLVGSGTKWIFEGKLLASDGELGDRFGETVYIDGDTIGVGARFADAQMGSAYIFTRTDGVWTEQQKLTAPVRNAGDWFGTQIAVHGDTAIVGARTADDQGVDSGAAFVFTRAADIWSLEATLLPNGGGPGDEFGMAVDIDADTAAVSALKDDDNGTESGAVYIFTRSDMSWSEQQKLLATDDDPVGDQLGTQLVVQGETLLVGGLTTRAAYLFTRLDGSWAQQAKIETTDTFAGGFGTSVALDGQFVVIGARASNDVATGSGSAFVFDLDPDAVLVCLEDLTGNVMSFNLRQGIENALDAKLEAILFALDDASNGDAIQATNMLIAFNQNVEAQRGVHLTDDQADTLIGSAQVCIDLIGN